MLYEQGVTISQGKYVHAGCTTTKKCHFHCMYDLMSYTLFYINYLVQLYLTSSYKKCTIKYKLGDHMCELATEYRTMFI
jgi:hypothetical protein